MLTTMHRIWICFWNMIIFTVSKSNYIRGMILTHVNFPFLISNIPQSPDIIYLIKYVIYTKWYLYYGVFVSQLIRYARAFSLYEDYIMRSQLLTSKLLKQGFTRNRPIATFKKFYGRRSVLIDRFIISVTNIIIDMFLETLYRWWLSSVPFYSQSFYWYWRLVTLTVLYTYLLWL